MNIRLLLLLTLAFSSGCSVVQRPESRVLGVTVTQRSAEGARVEVLVELTNPNATPLPLRHSGYQVSVGDGDFAFTQRLDVTLPGNGTQRVVLPAAFADGVSIGAQTPYVVRGSVAYEPPGEFRRILTDMGIPLPTSPFDASGELE